MPSFSKVLKNGQSSEVIPFSSTALNEVSTTLNNPDTLSVDPKELADFSTKLEKTEVKTDKRNLLSNAQSMVWMISKSSIIHEEELHSMITPWSIQEIQQRSTSGENNDSTKITSEHASLLTAARAEADEIITEARKTAAIIKTEAENESESLKQKAFMEGMNTAKSEASETMHQVERIFRESQLWQEQMMHQSQGRMIEMVMAIGKKLFGEGFELAAEHIDHIVSRAINDASRLGNLRIYLNPEDAKVLVNLWQESEITLNGQQIQIVSSQNILRGGCFIDGQFGIVDGRVEEQLDQITGSIKSAEANLETEKE